MEIKVNSKELAPRIDLVCKVINSKNALPILSDILIEVKNLSMMLTASDSEMWLSVKCPVVACDAETRFCVKATDFQTAIKNLDGADVCLALNEEASTLTCNYGKGKFVLPYEKAEEFPTINTDKEGETTKIIDGAKLLKAIELTGFATASDELRPVMNGIHFDFFADGMVAATSDGHKLARYKDATITGEEERSLTLPKKPATVLMPILNAIGEGGQIKLAFTDKAITVSNSNFRLIARLLDARYPNYEAVIPKNSPIRLEVGTNDLSQALKRVLPMANGSSNLIELDIKKDNITIVAQDYDYSKSATETISCACNADIKIGFEGGKLLDILKNINDDKTVVELSEPNRACLFYMLSVSKDTYLSLCMPMLTQ